MKKITTILAMALVVALCIGCLVACGGEGGIEGTYELYSVEMNGAEVVVDELPEEMGSIRGAKLAIKSGDKATLTFGEETQEGTWTLSEDGKTLAVTIEEDTLDFAVDGNKITATMDGIKMTFKK